MSLALAEFGDCQQSADIMVAHNLSFDKRVILAACRRTGVRQYFFVGTSVKPEYCTMKRTKDFPLLDFHLIRNFMDDSIFGTGDDVMESITSASTLVGAEPNQLWRIFQ